MLSLDACVIETKLHAENFVLKIDRSRRKLFERSQILNSLSIFRQKWTWGAREAATVQIKYGHRDQFILQRFVFSSELLV